MDVGGCSYRVRDWVGNRVGIPGGYWEGILGGLYRGTTQPLAHPPDSDRRERAPALQGWSGSRVGVYGDGGRDGPVPTPAGPGRAPVPSLVQDLANCPPTAKGARFQLISYKVSQNGVVSLKKCP